jgi:hypothetical protein
MAHELLNDCMIHICANCQKEFSIVTPSNATVSHGICNRHFELTLKACGLSQAKIEATLSKNKENKCKDLACNPLPF